VFSFRNFSYYNPTARLRLALRLTINYVFDLGVFFDEEAAAVAESLACKPADADAAAVDELLEEEVSIFTTAEEAEAAAVEAFFFSFDFSRFLSPSMLPLSREL